MTAKKSTTENRYSITGYIILIFGLAGICALLLFLNQNRLTAYGVTMQKAWMTWGGVFSVVLSGAVTFPFWLRRKYRKEQNIYTPDNILGSNGIQQVSTRVNSTVSLPLDEIRTAMRHQYGRTWSRKLRILLVTGNRSLVARAQGQVQLVSAEKQPLATRLHALSELQKTFSRLQYRADRGAPWYTRGGLSQNDALMAALFPRYAENAIPLLRDAAAVHLQQQLNAYVQLPPDSPLREKMTRTAWEQLKLYLMLARPERMDAAWFSGALMQNWPQRPGVKDGVWQGTGASLLRFYGANLPAHPAWRLHPDDGLVSQVRTLLVRQMGIRAREGVNNNAKGASLATVVRIYQLKDRKAFDSTDYPSLFAMDSQAIKADLVAEKDIRLRPGESFSLDMPMEEAAQFVAVAGMFMAPDQENNTWRLVITRDELDPDTPRIIEASHNSLTLQPLKDD